MTTITLTNRGSMVYKYKRRFYTKVLLVGTVGALALALATTSVSAIYQHAVSTKEMNATIQTLNEKIISLESELTDYRMEEEVSLANAIMTTDKPNVMFQKLILREQSENALYLPENAMELRELQYKSTDLREPSGVTATELDIVLYGTGLEGLGGAYTQAESEYGINALFLMALTAQESAWGTSNLAKGKNNITSFCAYDGSAYSSAMSFDSKAECIITTAEWLSAEYLSEDGRYFEGYASADLNVHYASDVNWYRNIDSIAKTALAKISTQDN